MTLEEIKNNFIKENTDIKESKFNPLSFGPDGDNFVDQIMKKDKTATSGLNIIYDLIPNLVKPQENEYAIIIDSKNEAKAIIKYTKVYTEKFKNISEAHAFKDAVGDKTLKTRKEVHSNFFTQILNKFNLKFDENIDVLCIEFELVYTD